jgi:sulfate adenylyltransferase subunit 2
MTRTLTHLDRLEAESDPYHARSDGRRGQARDAVFSVGKDSAVMLHLARKAFYPSPPPFPLLHVDTTWKFQDDVRAARHAWRAESGMELLVYQNPEAAKERGINPFDHGPLHTDMWKTEGLKTGARPPRLRRRPSAARAATRKKAARRSAFSRSAPLRTAGIRRSSAPSSGTSTTPARRRAKASASSRSANWTELDIWQYIAARKYPDRTALFRRAAPDGGMRDGLLLMVDDDPLSLAARRDGLRSNARCASARSAAIRLRVRSRATASTLSEVIQEMLLTTTSERQGRVIDKDAGGAGMEKKKQEGYF